MDVHAKVRVSPLMPWNGTSGTMVAGSGCHMCTIGATIPSLLALQVQLPKNMVTRNVMQAVYLVLASDLFAWFICDLFVWVKSDLHVWVIKRSRMEEAGIWNSKQPVFYWCFNWMIPNHYIKKRLFHQTSIKTRVLRVPGSSQNFRLLGLGMFFFDNTKHVPFRAIQK